jgi:hypothetical protein
MIMFAKRSHKNWTPIEWSFTSQSTTRLMQICNEMQGMNKLDQIVHFYYKKLKSLSENSLPSGSLFGWRNSTPLFSLGSLKSHW